MPAGLTDLPAGTIQRLGFTTGGTVIGGVSDNIQPITVASIAGFGSAYVEYTWRFVSGANALTSITADYHRPNHVVLSPISTVFEAAATGAGDVFKTTATVGWLDTGPLLTGDYHINVTALTGGGGDIRVLQGRVLGVKT